VRRSFWLLVAVALGVEATAAFFAQRVLVQVACHVPGQSTNVAGMYACVEQVPLVGRRPWLPALPIGVVVVVSVGLGGYECVRQLFRLHRLQCSLRSLGEPSAGLVDRVAHLGLRAVQVVSTDEVLCFCTGLLRPRIVVSTGLVELLDQAELEAVLAHEASHRRRRDPLRLMVADVAIRGLFFVPALPDLARAARVTTELEADAAAVDRYGNTNLLRALRSVLEAVSRAPAGVSPVGESDLMRERVQALGGDQPRVIIGRRRFVASIAALAVLLSLGFAVPSASKTPPPLPVHRIVPPGR
jgi:beta-lactamase regulating signal transducer with metallopeptidase domain